MERYFNTEGRCRPDLHYMVRLDDRLRKMKEQFVDRGKYFVINRGRQYGKTTTLMALAEYLKEEYIVFSLDFQMMSSSNFSDEETFVISFIESLEDLLSLKKELRENIDTEAFQSLTELKDSRRISLDKLFRGLSGICRKAGKGIVLIIDEVDSASNYRVFLDFLAMLRGYYLNRDTRPTFHSVILAGVYDIKNLKLKLRPEEEHQYNSPWNTREGDEPNESLLSLGDRPRDQMALAPFDIAADFDIRMSFSVSQIEGMLEEYEADHHVGMDVKAVADEIDQYTSGYPYLVSLICKLLDEKLPGSEPFLNDRNIWAREGVTEAVKMILKTNTPLFDSLTKQLDAFEDLRELMRGILFQGKRVIFSPDTRSINLGIMFGFLKDTDGQVAVSNRIFEMRMLNLFISEESVKSEIYFRGQSDRNQFIADHKLNMKLVLEKFVTHFADIYGDNDQNFVEEYGRKFFLLYLKPIINGGGNYYMEARTRDAKRTDVIVDYLGEQYIVELKIWHGDEYNKRGEKQLAEYLDYYHQDKGYLLSFNFNKKKERGVKELRIADKVIVEAVV